MKRYDITLIMKKGDSDYRVYFIYPNEDNGELTPTIWESHHHWDGVGTIQNFSETESKAYLYEDYKSIEECFDKFDGPFIWFNSEKEIEDHLQDLKDGDIAVWFYKEA